MKRAILILISFCFCVLASFTSQAHEARPLLVEITEQTLDAKSNGQQLPFQYEVYWKIPPSVVEKNMMPTITMPENCKVIGGKIRPQALGKRVYLCDAPLSGQQVGLEYQVANPSVTSLFRVNLKSGEQYSNLLKPGVNSWQVPDAEDGWSIAKDYTVLGVQHIWEGIDHLLFVACLIFIARRFKRIVVTITGFTVSHSITLVLSTLGLVSVPVPPVEAVIALSIVFLAHEIASKDKDSWTFRYPVIVSSSFGLLHGFGFAAVLNDLGLPQTELGTALLCFNLGVEIGQLLFILAISGVFMSTSKLLQSRIQNQLSMTHLQTVASYFIGIVATYWMFERLMGFWI